VIFHIFSALSRWFIDFVVYQDFVYFKSPSLCGVFFIFRLSAMFIWLMLKY